MLMPSHADCPADTSSPDHLKKHGKRKTVRENEMKKKRIMALLGVIVVVVCALLTLVFALLGYSTLWKASAYCMVVIPVIIYVMMWLAKLLENRGNKR